MLKTLLFLSTFGLIHAQGWLTPDCETFENGCPVDFSINLLLPHETSCRSFYQCVAGVKVLRRCPRHTWFNEEKQACDHPVNVDRTCEDDASPERPDRPSSEEVTDFLPNGCPADFEVNWHLPHERYCNLYYHCVFGDLVVRQCQDGLQFNATSQRCDYPSNVNCRLPGGNYVSTTTLRPPNPPGGIVPPTDVEDNGCPKNHSIDWLLPHEDCTLYYQCVWGGLVVRPCPAGLHFNPSKQICDNPATAGCANFYPCEEDKPCSGERSSEEDLPPGGDCPGGGPGCEGEDPPPPVECPGGPNCSSEEDIPPGGDCPGGGPGCEVPPPDDEDCDDDPPPGPPGNKCEEECVTFPWAHEDCDKFWYCYGNRPVLGTCSNGLYFNPATRTCDFACNVDCDSARVRVTPKHEGLNLYIPWNKFDDSARQLLKVIGQ